MPQSKKTPGATPEREDHDALAPESHVRLKPKRLLPRTYEEFLQALETEGTELDRELDEAMANGSISRDDMIEQVVASRLELGRHLLNDEQRAELAAKMRAGLQKFWRDPE
jgi:hypothetical protein